MSAAEQRDDIIGRGSGWENGRYRTYHIPHTSLHHELGAMWKRMETCRKK